MPWIVASDCPQMIGTPNSKGSKSVESVWCTDLSSALLQTIIVGIFIIQGIVVSSVETNTWSPLVMHMGTQRATKLNRHQEMQLTQWQTLPLAEARVTRQKNLRSDSKFLQGGRKRNRSLTWNQFWKRKMSLKRNPMRFQFWFRFCCGFFSFSYILTERNWTWNRRWNRKRFWFWFRFRFPFLFSLNLFFGCPNQEMEPSLGLEICRVAIFFGLPLCSLLLLLLLLPKGAFEGGGTGTETGRRFGSTDICCSIIFRDT